MENHTLRTELNTNLKISICIFSDDDNPTDGPTDDSGDLDHFQAQVLARHNELRVRHRVGELPKARPGRNFF